MPVKFDNPWLLLLIPAALFLMVWIGRKGKWGSAFRRNLSMAVRSLVLIALILALCGTGVRKSAKKTTTIFAVDLSASTEGTASMARDFVSQAASIATADHHMGVLCFGENAVVEANPTDSLTVEGFSSLVKKQSTNLAKAMETAAALMPDNSKKRIVLLSDGNETLGDAYATAKLLAAAGYTIDVYPLETPLTEEVQLSAVRLPEVVNKNVAYSIELEIESLTENSAWVKLYKDSTLIVNEEVSLRSGANRLQFTDQTSAGGSVVYRAEVQSEADTLPENNQLYATCYITDVPRVLVLEEGGSGTEIEKLLTGANVEVTMMQAGSAPTAMERLTAYDGVILANVAYDALPEGFDTALESYVRLTGGGLITTGGETAYALGGYYGTVLESILPVSMDLRTEEESADLGMIFVIDRSGSMMDGQYGLSKMEMAKEAVIRAVDSLTEIDSMGVVAFDSIGEWAVPFQTVGGNQAGIRESVSGIQAEGGTSILPALQMAYDTILAADCRLKHIVLLTDGQAERTGYESILSGMKNNGITLSTIAVGSGSDTALLQNLAERADGRYYFTNEFTDLPEIFAKETLLAGKEYINNRSFYPTAAAASPVLSGIDALPGLDGYIGTTAKPRADLVLKSDRDEPILAAWQYGLGKTLAWTSDMAGQWTAGFLAAPEGQTLFRNMVSYVLRTPMDDTVSVSGEIQGDESLITIKTDYERGYSELNATALSSDNVSYDLELSATAPGVYQAKLPTTAQGVYIVNLQGVKDGVAETFQAGFALAYSKEYDISGRFSGPVLLERIAELTGGRVLTDPAQLDMELEGALYAYTDCTLGLMLAALLLLFLDIALRRFTYLVDRFAAKFAKKPKPAAKKKPAADLPGKTDAPVSTSGKPDPAPAAKPETPAEQMGDKPAATASVLLKNKRKRGK